MTTSSLSDRLDQLLRRGVQIVDPRQTFVDDIVRLDRIFPGSMLFPGTRLIGNNTLVAPGAKIGSEGPATVIDSAVGQDAEIASGYVAGSVLLGRARVGSNGHIRAGTLLEEEASTAHAVGLKQTVLLSYVTLGSLINCCDCLISGGRSRSNHTQIGSGFIHFNFTPWGESGDKATPSLFGGVPRGVFLREERIFIGGASGMVGPNHVGFGSFTAAGQVIRTEVPANRVHSEVQRKVDAPWDFQQRKPSGHRIGKNLEYIGHLVALRVWYQMVRKPRSAGGEASSHLSMTLDAAIELLDGNIAERWTRLGQFLGSDLPPLNIPRINCPLLADPDSLSHLQWLKNLSGEEVRLGCQWLQEVVDAVVVSNRIDSPPRISTERT
jgi:UDP-N-acetylglucosamine/UDP-N-acetylgalactosamine diphosphorylase